MSKRLPSVLVLLLAGALFTLPCLAASRTRHAAAHAVLSHSVRGRHVERAERVAAVHHEAAPSMETGRATEIQAALIRAGYLSGQPSGVWDADSVAAMQKLQDANGWQTKYTPDSRALVKLGLGATPVTVQPARVAETAPTAAPVQP